MAEEKKEFYDVRALTHDVTALTVDSREGTTMYQRTLLKVHLAIAQQLTIISGSLKEVNATLERLGRSQR